MNRSRDSFLRTRWAALGAVAAIILGAAGTQIVLADVTTGDKPVFVAVSPKRIADTRIDVGIVNRLSSGVPKTLKVTGSVPIAPSGTATVVPVGATSVVLNVTAVTPTRAGYVSVRPGDATGTPTTSSLNVVAGVTVPNAVTIALPTTGANAGKIQIWYQGASGQTHILVDVVGYYDDHTHDDRYYTETQTKDLIFDQRTFVGTVASDGTKGDSGAYTSSRSSAGVYSVTFDTTGLGIVTTQMPPNVTATASWLCAAGSTTQAAWFTYSFLGPDVTSFSASIRTYNAAAVPADCSTQFHINFAAPASLVLPEPGASAADAEAGEFPPDTQVVCRNQPDGVVCKPAD